MQVGFSPKVARRVLRYELERLYEQSGKTHALIAERLGVTRANVTHILSGKNMPSKPALEVLSDFFQRPDRLPMLLDLLAASKARVDQPGAPLSTMNDFELLVGLEAVATNIETFEPTLVTGLLQTEGYARALIGYHATITPGVDVEQSIEVRLQRQSAITREQNPVALWCVLEERALRRPVGDGEVMRAQLDHLLAMTERHNITLQVVPQTIGVHPALKGAFFLLRFDDDWRLAYEETRRSAYYYDSADAVEDYGQAMNHLRHLALDPKRSRVLLAQLRKDVQ